MKWSVFIVWAVMLSACSVDPPATVDRYDLGNVKAQPSGSAQLRVPISVPPVEAPSWLGGRAMIYRLAYLEPSRPQIYSRAGWMAPPAELVTERLRRSIAAVNDDFTMAGRRTEQVRYALEITLEDFSQVFSSAESSMGVIQMRATLIDLNRNSVVAQTSVQAQGTAPSPDAQGGVHALGEATQNAIDQLLAWLSVTTQQEGAPTAARGEARTRPATSPASTMPPASR